MVYVRENFFFAAGHNR